MSRSNSSVAGDKAPQQRVAPNDVLRALDVKTLLSDASSAAGLFDFGRGDIETPLSRIRDCYAADAKFHVEGLNDLRAEIVRELVNRLRFQDDLKRHPEILEEDVSDPIVIIGLPRSGTTKAMRMIGADPNLLKTAMWQLVNPAPFPDASPGETDPRIAAAYADNWLDDNPEIQATHFYGPYEVNEDLWLYDLTFNDPYFRPGRTPSASFQKWARERKAPSDLDNYKYVRGLVQYLQWQQGGRRGRRWLIKNTAHMAYLDELLEVYPNATLVHLHRDPRSCVASVAKMSTILWKLRLMDVDLETAGRYHLERTKYATDRYMEARDRLSLNDRIIDVQYDQIRKDPMPAIREVYRRAGQALPPESEQAMLDWEHNNEQGKHGAHEYSLAQLGLSEELIDSTLSEYIARFIKRS